MKIVSTEHRFLAMMQETAEVFLGAIIAESDYTIDYKERNGETFRLSAEVHTVTSFYL
jgi:hypothetical protein